MDTVFHLWNVFFVVPYVFRSYQFTNTSKFLKVAVWASPGSVIPNPYYSSCPFHFKNSMLDIVHCLDYNIHTILEKWIQV